MSVDRSNMYSGNIGLVLIVLVSTWSCASTDHAPPFDQESNSGITYWVVSPVRDRHTYAFHWDNETLSIARSSETGMEYSRLPISDCPLLEARLIQFRESILDSVEIVFVRKPAIPVTEIVADSPLYRVKYAPDRFSTNVKLEGYEGSKVPWIAAARAVRERETACNETGQDSPRNDLAE